ncbi:type II toxin-antitoxin system VapC family toxin [Spirulina sp. CCNP1310]|uniref:type II toxin-antitoxin system VapC family toxin n=1 Tax=Spirulina sp. CCNP1310 TaxID=3110249 RepID=UPI002B20E7D5|nr:type II toxin-antitoxin system VapC family toxin [Spirulina sp. CCNP1310]MEA5418254.1 type II toxin-antitoxin system VapC family toxin [Spirulina sp. CCNP1310]
MTDFLIDSNVILDVLTEDLHWFDWSAAQLADCAESGTLHINPIIYAEVSIGFKDVTEVEAVFRFFQRDGLPYEAAFLAGQAFLAYRRRGGVKRSPLPDFYIGAHGVVCGYNLLTRDATRYQTYFPELVLISPKSSG